VAGLTPQQLKKIEGPQMNYLSHYIDVKKSNYNFFQTKKKTQNKNIHHNVCGKP
jgi:hypothetical protein